MQQHNFKNPFFFIATSLILHLSILFIISLFSGPHFKDRPTTPGENVQFILKDNKPSKLAQINKKVKINNSTYTKDMGAEINNPKTPTNSENLAEIKNEQVSHGPHTQIFINPEYPIEARKNGEEGRVELEITLSAEGEILSINNLAPSAPKSLVQASITAVKKTLIKTNEKLNSNKNVTTLRPVFIFKLKD